MACTSKITLNGPHGPFKAACKQCLNCRMTKQSAVSLRALLESRLASSGEFLTLTYSEAPDSLVWKDFSDFMKRLRVKNSRLGNPETIRFLGCGEYGERYGRPHFHALIFNHIPLANTDLLTKLWPHGFSYIGTVTPASVRYTARYCLKFAPPGKEPLDSWSTSPPLGVPGMRLWGQHMAQDPRWKAPEPPLMIRLEGNTYVLDQRMRDTFREGWNSVRGEGALPPPSRVASHLRWMDDCVFGDPVAQQALRQQNRREFLETARFFNGKF